MSDQDPNKPPQTPSSADPATHPGSVGLGIFLASVLVDSRLIDFHKPVKLEVNGQVASRTLQPRLRVLCETLLRQGDPDLAFVAEIELPFGKAGAR